MGEERGRVVRLAGECSNTDRRHAVREKSIATAKLCRPTHLFLRLGAQLLPLLHGHRAQAAAALLANHAQPNGVLACGVGWGGMGQDRRSVLCLASTRQVQAFAPRKQGTTLELPPTQHTKQAPHRP